MTGDSHRDSHRDDADEFENAHTAKGLIDARDVPGVTDPESGIAGDAADGGTDDLADGADAPDPGPDAEQLARERARLIDLLVYAWDRARSPGVWERLTVGLAEVGVSVLRPDGEPFDPNRHEVGGVESTDDDALVDTVAETEVAGFSDRGRVLREPIVVVYRRSSPS